MDKKIIAVVVIILLLIGGVITWGVLGGKTEEITVSMDTTIYYYGAECPHCKRINDFLEENHVAEKVNFTKKEVWHDSGNAKEMTAAAAQCGIDKKDIGVPFIFDKGTCFVGEPDVKKFFSDKAGITATETESTQQ